jgi:hypothetical protein
MFCNELIIKPLRYVHRTSIFVHLLKQTDIFVMIVKIVNFLSIFTLYTEGSFVNT